MSALERFGVPADATLDQVKARWRELARKHHPDLGGDALEFARVGEQYEAALRELEVRRCGACGGEGTVPSTMGFFTARLLCPTCHGAGR